MYLDNPAPPHRLNQYKEQHHQTAPACRPFPSPCFRGSLVKNSSPQAKQLMGRQKASVTEAKLLPWASGRDCSSEAWPDVSSCLPDKKHFKTIEQKSFAMTPGPSVSTKKTFTTFSNPSASTQISFATTFHPSARG